MVRSPSRTSAARLTPAQDWQCLRFLIEVFEARYPETLGVFCMHKAPMIINPIWAIIKPLLDPVVRDKIVFTYTGDDLAEYIPRKHIEKHMGGEADMAFSYTKPVEGENKRMQEDSEEKTQALKCVSPLNFLGRPSVLNARTERGMKRQSTLKNSRNAGSTAMKKPARNERRKATMSS